MQLMGEKKPIPKEPLPPDLLLHACQLWGHKGTGSMHPATQDFEAGESLEPISSKSAWAA